MAPVNWTVYVAFLKPEDQRIKNGCIRMQPVIVQVLVSLII